MYTPRAQSAKRISYTNYKHMQARCAAICTTAYNMCYIKPGFPQTNIIETRGAKKCARDYTSKLEVFFSHPPCRRPGAPVTTTPSPTRFDKI